MTVAITDHRNQPNIYEKRTIINSNISRIVQFQNSREYINISGKNRIEICKLLEKQRKIQKELNYEIMQKEQTVFNFGG